MSKIATERFISHYIPDYFASPDLMFPAHVNDESQLLRKDYIFGFRSVAASKAWPLNAFAKEPVINDQVQNFANQGASKR